MFKSLILAALMISSAITPKNAVPGGQVELPLTNEKVVTEAYKTSDYIYVADVALYKGKIVEINEREGSLDLMVTKEEKNENTYESLIFHINENTQSNVDKKSLKIGDTLDVFYSGAVTRSLPGQASAIAINLVKSVTESFTYEGKIKEIIEIKDYKMISVVSKKEENATGKNLFVEDEIRFTLGANTKFNGGSSSDLKEGDRVKVVYGPVMAMSMPPITSAWSVEILK